MATNPANTKQEDLTIEEYAKLNPETKPLEEVKQETPTLGTTQKDIEPKLVDIPKPLEQQVNDYKPVNRKKDNKQFVEARKELSEIEKEEYLKNEKDKFNKENSNTSFGDYKYDNTAYNPKGEHLIGKKDEELTSREIKQRDKAEAKIEANQRDYEKFMDFVRQYDKYNQYGGAFNYDQFTSSVDPKTIRAAAKALGVGGLARVGIATQELYNAARKEMQKKYDVAYQERQAIQAEKKKAEDALKDRIKDDAKLNELQEYIYNWSQALSGDPKDFEANQAEFIKGLQQRLADAGFETKVDGIPEQQTFRSAIEAMAERNPELKDLFVASGVMMPVGYEKASPLDKWLDGDDKEREEYELRFAQRRDQRNRFAQSLVDLAGITSRMIAASGGAKMEPYKDMYDKFREDMKAARARYDERMGEIRQREIDAEKEAYTRIREREKADLAQKNFENQSKQQADQWQKTYELQKQRQEDLNKYRNSSLAVEKQKADNYAKAHQKEQLDGLAANYRIQLLDKHEALKRTDADLAYDGMLDANANFKTTYGVDNYVYSVDEILRLKERADIKRLERIKSDYEEDLKKFAKLDAKEDNKASFNKLMDEIQKKYRADNGVMSTLISESGLDKFL